MECMDVIKILKEVNDNASKNILVPISAYAGAFISVRKIYKTKILRTLRTNRETFCSCFT